MAQTLLGLYPTRELNDPKTYTAALIAAFQSFPSAAGRAVLHPVTGIAGRCKFHPSVAEVVGALRTETERLSRPWQSLEDLREEAQARRLAYQAQEPTPEQKRACRELWEDMKSKLTGIDKSVNWAWTPPKPAVDISDFPDA